MIIIIINIQNVYNVFQNNFFHPNPQAGIMTLTCFYTKELLIIGKVTLFDRCALDPYRESKSLIDDNEYRVKIPSTEMVYFIPTGFLIILRQEENECVKIYSTALIVKFRTTVHSSIAILPVKRQITCLINTIIS